MQIWALSTKDPATEPQTCVEFELTQSSDSVTTLWLFCIIKIYCTFITLQKCFWVRLEDTVCHCLYFLTLFDDC